MVEPEVGRDVHTGAESVWEVLADGWAYPLWVVGATHMRDVDDDWPAVGSRLHHSVGMWPFQLRDQTEVLDVEPGHRLELLARAWPAGSAKVRLTIEPRGPEGCHVRMWEAAADAPWRWVPHWAQAPGVLPRNTECLSRLADVAEHRNRA